MIGKKPEFTIGVEEEYLLVDRKTRDLVSDPSDAMMRECGELLKGQVAPEFPGEFAALFLLHHKDDVSPLDLLC